MAEHYSKKEWLAFLRHEVPSYDQMLEHVSNCPQCMEEYTALLQESALLTPPRGMTEEILEQAVLQRTVVAILPQVMKILLCSALSLAVWIGSSYLVTPGTVSQAAHEQIRQQMEQIDRRIQKDKQREVHANAPLWNWKDLWEGIGGR